MNENHDEQGRFATAEGTTFMGAHGRLDKLTANAHAKLGKIKPENWQVTKVGKQWVLHNEGDTTGQKVRSKELGERQAGMMNQHARDRNADFHRERTSRATRAGQYMHDRSQRDIKYGKQLKLPL